AAGPPWPQTILSGALPKHLESLLYLLLERNLSVRPRRAATSRPACQPRRTTSPSGDGAPNATLRRSAESPCQRISPRPDRACLAPPRAGDAAAWRTSSAGV